MKVTVVTACGGKLGYLSRCKPSTADAPFRLLCLAHHTQQFRRIQRLHQKVEAAHVQHFRPEPFVRQPVDHNYGCRRGLLHLVEQMPPRAISESLPSVTIRSNFCRPSSELVCSSDSVICRLNRGLESMPLRSARSAASGKTPKTINGDSSLTWSPFDGTAEVAL